MIAGTRAVRLDGQEAVVEGAAAIRHLKGLGVEAPILVFYHPTATLNPYQQLLYSASWREGVASLPLADLDSLPDIVALRAAGAEVVLHLHWTTDVLAGIEDPAEAEEAIASFIRRLDQFRGAGGRIVWTVHNVLPHDCRLPRQEAALQQAIVDRSDVVHVLAESTVTAAAEWFTIPVERVVHVPHAGYQGAYPCVVTRDQARFELGVDPDETVYAMVGALKPYKGAERLLDAFDALLARSDAPRRLLIAGEPDESPALEAFLERCSLHPFVTLDARRIPADEVQLFMRAADIAVLPYHRSLNSGFLMLAMTFGLPVVAPAAPGITEVLGPEAGRLFDPADDDGLVEALAAADGLRTAEARRAALRIAAEHRPDRLSRRFARSLRERLATPSRHLAVAPRRTNRTSLVAGAALTP